MSGIPQQQIQVLHVDDEPAIAELTGTFLPREDDRFTVETATSADEGLQLIDERQPDCVVSDYNMPGMDGLEFLQVVREEYPDLPFILFTGKGSEAVASDAISAGVTDYLQKQSSSEQYELLANRIQNAVTARWDAKEASRQRDLMRRVEVLGATGGWELRVESEELRLTDGIKQIYDVEDDCNLSLEEVIGFYEPAAQQEIRSVIDDAIDEGYGEVDDLHFQTASGKKRVVEGNAELVANDGDSTVLRGVIHDITDREERQRNLEQIETLFQHAQDSLFLIDASDEFTIERVNPAWEATTGLSAEQVRGQTPRSVLGEQPGATAESKYNECIQRQNPLQYEETIRVDGAIAHWVTQIAPVVVDGTVEYIAGSTQDITEQKQRRDNLEQARDLMRNMELLADAGAWEYTPESEQLMITDGTRRLYGLSPDAELTFEAALDAVHPDDRDRLADCFDNCLETGDPYEIEVRLTTSDGAQRWLTAQGERVSEGEADSVVRGYIRDITGEKTRERQLTELNQATQALLSAETRQEVANIGVEAASDVLDLQANAIHLSEAGDTQLVPAAQTADSVSLIGDAQPLPVADSIAGRVYREGEPEMITDVQQDPDVHNAETDLRGHLYLPLTDHGILIAASENRAAFDRQDLAFGELLAGTLVAAFDRVERERTARQRQEELSLFFEESPIGAVQWDDEFQFERLNERAKEILGYDGTELRGESWETIVIPDDHGKIGSVVENLLNADGGTYELNRNIRKDGEVITCEWHNRVVTDTTGDVQSIFSKFQDVTERENRKQELEEYETIIEALTDAVYVLDEEGRFTYVNDEFVELTGYDRETIIGNTPSLIKDPEAVEQAEQQLGQLLSTEGPETVTFEVTVHPRDCDPIICEDHMGILPYDGDQFNGSVGTLRDITDRKDRQRQLRRERERYTTLFEMLPNPVLHAKTENGEPVVETINPVFEKTFGYDAETIRDEPLQDYILPDDQTDTAKQLNQQVLEESAVKTEVRRETTDGIRTFRLNVSTRNTETEEHEGYAVYTDITEHKEREQELERQNDLFAKSQDLANVGAWEYNPQEEDSHFTDKVYEIYGVEPEYELSPEKDIQNFYHPDDRDTVRTAVEEALQSGKEYDIEARITAADGTDKWIRTCGTPQLEDGTVKCVRGTFQEITERKEREQELQEVNSQYETLTENFPDGAVFLIDTDLTYARAGGKELSKVGLSPTDVEGTNPHALFPEEIADELCHYYERALDGNANTFEQVYGGERYRIQTVPVWTDHEEVEYVMTVSQNITERAKDKQELERQNEQLEEFASIVSHDLRNPLQVADTRLELIREECESDHIDDVAQSLDRMDALIEDLLTLAREGEQVDETNAVGLANVAKSSWQTVNTEQAILETDTSRTVKADQRRLRQLFENLYRNAIEHGGNGVTVSVGAIDDGFYVADTGPGIPEDDREGVFEAGYSTNEEGTGFGLRIVEQIAEAHGWEITVTAGEQGGARLEFNDVEFSD